MHVAYATNLAADELLTTAAMLGHEPGLGQHGHVLLHRGKAHRIEASKPGYRQLAAECARHDVAPRGVGERMEQPVGSRRVDNGLSYNHLVVG